VVYKNMLPMSDKIENGPGNPTSHNIHAVSFPSSAHRYNIY